jgi:hypothetical protein
VSARIRDIDLEPLRLYVSLIGKPPPRAASFIGTAAERHAAEEFYRSIEEAGRGALKQTSAILATLEELTGRG